MSGLKPRRHAARHGAALLALGFVAFQARSADESWPPAPGTAPEILALPGAWPDDPLYGYRAGILDSERASGQWPLYSFLPERSEGAPERETLEESAGSSVDRAWTQTIGSRRVTIALLGTGTDWSESDLVERLSLSIGELRTRPPLHADGTPCAPLDFQQPGRDLFDCNFDGQLTVADYAADPGLMPEASADRPRGDMNENGVLDAQDLLLQFSDGTDNDDNGYVDDIVGWDFDADDNDPTDPLERAEITLQAVISAGNADNGVGRAGVCPRCRLLPLRVGNELLVEPQRLGEAIVYATDRGAAVIYFAIESLGATQFVTDAVDYAAGRGALVIVPSGTRNSRTQRPLTTLNRTVTVGGISLLGDEQQSTTARSYVAFDTCGNFGAQLLLSAPSPDCAQEGASLVAGVAGLMQSAALQSGYDPELPGGTSRLSAAELRQLLVASADDVFVLDSDRSDSSHYPSQPGFDQRFGFGRVNAFGAVDAIVRDRIPPEITLTSPRWFETLNEVSATAPLKFLGTIRARRATRYSYVIDWAPGAEPRDSDFVELERASNVAATVVTGENGVPLAELDIRNLDLQGADDRNGTLGENARTVTVRVRATAHYAGAAGDANGELRRSFNVVEDPELLEGFPLRIGAAGRAGPKLADMDGDGTRDIVVATLEGRVEAFSLAGGRPERIPGFPLLTGVRGSLTASEPRVTRAPAYRDGLVDPLVARQGIFGAPALSDLDGDGALDIVIATVDGVVHAFSNDGNPIEGWPVTLPEVLPCDAPDADAQRCSSARSRIARGALASPVIADIDADSRLEIVQAGLDGYLHAFEVNGDIVEGWPHRVHHESARPRPLTTSPAVGDFDGDGRAELLIGGAEQLDSSEALGAFTLLRTLDGKPLGNWPVSVETRSLEPLIGEGAAPTPLAADVDADGRVDAVVHGNGGVLWALPANPGTQAEAGARPSGALPDPAEEEATEDDPAMPIAAFAPDQIGVAASAALRGPIGLSNFQAAAGDLDQDGFADIVGAGAEARLMDSVGKVLPRAERGRHVIAMYNGRTGAIVPTSPSVLEDTPELSAPAVADITGDGYPEAIVGSAGYRVHALDACGRPAPGWPKQTGQWVVGAPAVGDIDGDGRLDVVVATHNGWVFAWSTAGPAADGVVAWESTHHDLRNTSNYETPLDQGTLRSSAPALRYAADGSCITEEQPPEDEPEPTLRARGGCAMAAAAPERRQRDALGALVVFLLLVRRCSRRRLDAFGRL